MTTSPRRITPAALSVPVVVFLCWAVPRAVVSVFGIDGLWAPFLYQYLLGGLVFLIGLWVIRTSGACNLERREDRIWFRVLIFGYLWYALIHGTVTWLAGSVPFRGM